jgi:DNA-binding NarL/FixJ family response regulator
MTVSIRVAVALAEAELAERVALLLAETADIEQVDSDAADITISDDGRGMIEIVTDVGTLAAVLSPHVDREIFTAALRLVAAGFIISIPAPDDPADQTESLLTPRESEVMALLASGASNKAIARELGISPNTAKFHVAAVLAKLGARNRSDAVAIAMRRGLVLI